jgi:hypothetical protein
VASKPVVYTQRGTYLLELLHFAGWQLRIRRGKSTTIFATRDAVTLEVTETSLPRAAGVMFARAMRSGQARLPE